MVDFMVADFMVVADFVEAVTAMELMAEVDFVEVVATATGPSPS